MTGLREITDGLIFPEGPVAMPDGTVVLVEIGRGCLTRVLPDGRKEVVATPGGGPNGIAIGPDGKAYVCNNGGFEFVTTEHGTRPVREGWDYSGGRIERIDLETGAVEVLYRGTHDVQLRGPNDIVFDAHGGFYFTDRGRAAETLEFVRHSRKCDRRLSNRMSNTRPEAKENGRSRNRQPPAAFPHARDPRAAPLSRAAIGFRRQHSTPRGPREARAPPRQRQVSRNSIVASCDDFIPRRRQNGPRRTVGLLGRVPSAL